MAVSPKASLPLGLMFLVSLGVSQTPPSLEEGRQVMGLMVMSADKKLISKAEGEFKFAMLYSDLKATFSGKRFAVFPWGKRSAILIDKESGIFGAETRKAKVLQILVNAIGQNSTVQLSKLDSETRSLVIDMLLVPPVFLEGSDPESGKVGLSTGLTFTISGSNGASITHAMPPRDLTTQQMTADLAKNPISFRNPAPDEIPSLNDQWLKKVATDQEVHVELLGIAPDNFAEGLAVVSPLVQSLQNQLKDKLKSVAAMLASKLHPDGTALPSGKCSVSDLPPGVRQELFENFSLNWKSNGFSSADAAQNFLATANLQVGTNIYLSFERPGVSSANSPARPTGGSIWVGSVAGGVG